jgi:chromosome condensin MukBEF complex kleisin-like MukF subunit
VPDEGGEKAMKTRTDLLMDQMAQAARRLEKENPAYFEKVRLLLVAEADKIIQRKAEANS